jgi:hypothetical protein
MADAINGDSPFVVLPVRSAMELSNRAQNASDNITAAMYLLEGTDMHPRVREEVLRNLATALSETTVIHGRFRRILDGMRALIFGLVP